MNRQDRIEQNIDLDTFSVDIPSYQRILNDGHVESIYRESLRYLQLNLRPPFSPMSIAYYPEIRGVISIPRYNIIDGQHRYHAYMKLYRAGYRFLVDLHVISCANIEEAKHLYSIWNQRLEHGTHEIEHVGSANDLDKQIETLITSLITKFGPYKCQRPRIRIKTFMDRWMISNSRQAITSLEEFIIFLDRSNISMRDNLLLSPLYHSSVSNLIKMKAQELNWYLGIDLECLWLI